MTLQLVGENGYVSCALSNANDDPVVVRVEASISGFAGDGEVVCRSANLRDAMAKLARAAQPFEDADVFLGVDGNSLELTRLKLGGYALRVQLFESSGLAQLEARLLCDSSSVRRFASEILDFLGGAFF
ncbi:MAG: hypothetical protein ABL949_17205 [Fimbriimonadaceae bacterium]